MTQHPAQFPGTQLQPHRGATILVLGILSLVFSGGCGVGIILGIVAWVLGNSDLAAIRSGRMDPAGEGLTQAGRVCGMISVLLSALLILFGLLWLFVMGGLALFFSNAPNP